MTATRITATHAGFEVAFGFEDRDGFTCTKPSRTYKTRAGAERAAARFLARHW